MLVSDPRPADVTEAEPREWHSLLTVRIQQLTTLVNRHVDIKPSSDPYHRKLNNQTAQMLPRLLARHATRLARISSRTTTTFQHSHPTPLTSTTIRRASHTPQNLFRDFSSTPSRPSSDPPSSNKRAADVIVEEITELYATAQDEFEIAMEETEKVSVYAEDDRRAAREELEKVKEAFKRVVEGENREVAEEVSRRVGQRIRELEQGVGRMEEIAMEQD